MCEGCKQREAVIQAAMYFCGQVQTISETEFENIMDNMRNVHYTKLGEMIGHRARYELSREIKLAIKSELDKWELSF